MKRISMLYYTLFFLKMTSFLHSAQPPRRLQAITPPDSPTSLSLRSHPSTPLLPHPAAAAAASFDRAGSFEGIETELAQLTTPRLSRTLLAVPDVRSKCPCQQSETINVEGKVIHTPSKELIVSRKILLTGAGIGTAAAALLLMARYREATTRRGFSLDADSAASVASAGLSGLSSLLHTGASVAGTAVGTTIPIGPVAGAVKVGFMFGIVVAVTKGIKNFNGWLHAGCKEHDKVQELKCDQRVQEAETSVADALRIDVQGALDQQRGEVQLIVTGQARTINQLQKMLGVLQRGLQQTRMEQHQTRELVAQSYEAMAQNFQTLPAAAAAAAASSPESSGFNPTRLAAQLQTSASQVRSVNSHAASYDETERIAQAAAGEVQPLPEPQLSHQQLPLKQKTTCGGCCGMM